MTRPNTEYAASAYLRFKSRRFKSFQKKIRMIKNISMLQCGSIGSNIDFGIVDAPSRCNNHFLRFSITDDIYTYAGEQIQ